MQANYRGAITIDIVSKLFKEKNENTVSVIEASMKTPKDTKSARLQLPLNALATWGVIEGFPTDGVIDFGAVPVGQSKEIDLKLENPGLLSESLSFRVDHPFSISNLSLVIPAGGAASISIKFAPEKGITFSGVLNAFTSSWTKRVVLCGKTGYLQLQSNYSENLVNLGLRENGSRVLIPLILSNKGSLPLQIYKVICRLELHQKERVVLSSNATLSKTLKLEYLRKMSKYSSPTKILSHINGWCVLRSRYRDAVKVLMEEKDRESNDSMAVLAKKKLSNTSSVISKAMMSLSTGMFHTDLDKMCVILKLKILKRLFYF